jgi:hypothetical protein
VAYAFYLRTRSTIDGRNDTLVELSPKLEGDCLYAVGDNVSYAGCDWIVTERVTFADGFVVLAVERSV